MSDAMDGKRAIELGKEEVQRRLADGSAYLDVVLKGKWVESPYQSLREQGYYKCSVCGRGFQRFHRGIRKSDVPYIDGQPYELKAVDNFCPNCGADMREGNTE